jgi:outer membrane lipoprotein-sorting protein
MHRFRKLWICVALLAAIAMLPLHSHAAKAQSTKWNTDSILDQLDNEAKSFRSLTADIDRTKVTVVVNDKSTESGQILVRHDDKMRIDFTKPDPRTILRIGNDLFLYNPKINQLEEYDLSKRRSLVDQFLLLGFGTSGNALKKSFLPVLLGEEIIDNRKTLKLELTPKSDDVRNEVSKIQIWIDEATWLPDQQQFFETGSGDYLIIHYTNVVRNANISDNSFKQKWPKDVSRVKPQG